MCLSVLGHASRVIVKPFMLLPSLDYGALPNTSLLLLLKTREGGTRNGKENETKMQLNLTKQKQSKKSKSSDNENNDTKKLIQMF